MVTQKVMLGMHMLTTLQQRKRLAQLILIVSIIGAAYIAVPRGGDITRRLDPQNRTHSHWLIGVIESLNRKEPAHVLGHLLIFGSVAVLLGPWGADAGSVQLAARYAFTGAVVMEAVQVTVGYSDDTWRDLISGVAFDLAVDAIAVGLGLWFTWRYARQLTHIAEYAQWKRQNRQGV